MLIVLGLIGLWVCAMLLAYSMVCKNIALGVTGIAISMCGMFASIVTCIYWLSTHYPVVM